MKPTEQTIQQIERAIRKIAQKFPADEETSILTDIHLRVSQDSGELLAFDDDEQEINRCVIEQWIDNKDENFYDSVTIILRNELKRNNDTYGHEKGDIYLQKCCALLCQVYAHSPVFRVGGDEFVVILTGQDFVNRAALLLEVRKAFETTRTDRDLEPWERCSMAVGMAEYRPGMDLTFEELLDLADQNMYAEKVKIKSEELR